METKKHIRKQILTVRDSIAENVRREKSQKIASAIIEEEHFKKAGYILLYSDYKSEVETKEIFFEAKKQGKVVCYPKVEGDTMTFYQVNQLEDLQEGYKGILEPKEEWPYPKEMQENSFLIMPGVAFDKDGNRIGYGKGYYDKFLQNHSSLYKAGICFAEQVVEHIESEAYDKKIDVLYTDKGIYRNFQK